MTTFRDIRFINFINEILKYEQINIDEIYLLINRYTFTKKKSYFGRNWEKKKESQVRYHRHWIRMAEGIKVLEPIKIHLWNVNLDNGLKFLQTYERGKRK